MPIQNKIQLITYPDSLGSNLVELHYVLRRYFSEIIGGVHLLPFYPSSADRGFAPISYEEVDENFGNWEDIDLIGRDFDLMVDFMVNHISRQSLFFQDYLENGPESEFADMFLGFNKLSSTGEISPADLAKVYTRKPRPPYLEIERADGSREKIWCTFDYEQIDLDWWSPKTREVMRNALIRLARRPVKMIRMDAFAYTTIEIGTDCFFQEPKVWELLGWLKDFTAPFDTAILPEVHETYTYQLKLAEKGYWCYDFCLPMLTLHTLYHHTNKRLVNWLKICPRKQITTLDTHDGLGVVDVAGLMTEEEIARTVDGLYQKGSNAKKIYSGPDYQNLDVYQVNCTYYSALENNDESYLAARAIQFFTPGIPQVYYVGLLAGENDIELVEQTRNGRDINRHPYALAEINEAVQRPVVQRLMTLMAFRNTYPAFDGEFHIESSPEDELSLTWVNGCYTATLQVDLNTYLVRISYYDEERKKNREMRV